MGPCSVGPLILRGEKLLAVEIPSGMRAGIARSAAGFFFRAFIFHLRNFSIRDYSKMRNYVTLREVDLWFLSKRKEFDRGESFPIDYELNEIPFGSQSNGKLLSLPYSFRF